MRDSLRTRRPKNSKGRAIAGIAAHFKKKKKQTELEKQIQRRSTPRTSPEPSEKVEFPTSPAELIEMILKRKGRASEPSRVGPPKVEPPLRPARAPSPQRPAARSLDALHQDQVTIDSVEHARHISEGAQRLGRSSEERIGLLQTRFKERKRTKGKRVSTSRSKSSRSRYTLADLRRAIIMNEILGKPVALRDT